MERSPSEPLDGPGPHAATRVQGLRPGPQSAGSRRGAARWLLVVLTIILLMVGLFALPYLWRPAEPERSTAENGAGLEAFPEEAAPPTAGASPPVAPQDPLAAGLSPTAVMQSETAEWPVRLIDVTRQSGITFRHTDGSSGKFYIVESITGGVALFDYDLDGDLDIYFLNGAPLEGTEVEPAPTNALYRNEGDWRFTDVTEQAGVGDTGYGLGICIGDYDNDGNPDLYVNNFGGNALFKNNGDGTFAAVADASGVADGQRMGAGASFLDIDGDADLDLYVAHYVQFSLAEHRLHTIRGVPAYPGPLTYRPDPDSLYRNNGDGTFSDASAESGIAAHAGTGMGVVCSDYDGDGDTDIFVGNDQMANFLFRNDGSGRFEEVGLLAGTALDLAGHPQATMGVDAGDYNNDGRPDFHATSFADQFASLYRNLGDGLFDDVTSRTNAGTGTFPHVTWGNGFADFDNDGSRDLFIACGHLDVNLEGGGDTTAYRAPNVLLMNRAQRFVDVSAHSGEGMQVMQSSRGMALGDLDNDGDIDVVVLNSRSEPTILRNDSPAEPHWIRIRLCGTRSNRGGVGARVKVVAGELVQVSEVHSGRGYQSHFGDPLHFGLGMRDHVERVEVHWIGGDEDIVASPPVDDTLLITEGEF